MVRRDNHYFQCNAMFTGDWWEDMESSCFRQSQRGQEA
jgi:hypothetical protein